MSFFAGLQAPPLEAYHSRFMAAYLRLKGWRVHEYPRWFEFFGEPDADGEPLMLVLPKEPNAPDTKRYLDKAIDLLSALDDEPGSVLAFRIQHVYNDVFVVCNIETGIISAIPIRVADQQISELRHLVAWSAQAERNPRPYYDNLNNPSRFLEEFRFGHTLRGSFALTVEAPILRDADIFQSNLNVAQPPLFPDIAEYEEPSPEDNMPVERAPVERRIVERIMRGLVTAKQATEESSIAPVVGSYGSGFNGNMCSSIVELAKNTGPIEYGVLWSPRVPVAEDLEEHPTVSLDYNSYTILNEAAIEMRRRPLQEERIHGRVTHIGSDVDPLSDSQEGREVIIKWIREEGRRIAKIIVPLNREQYILAHDAHLRWATVEVTGKVVRSASGYRLADPHDFEVLN